jgi:hypothetical protein
VLAKESQLVPEKLLPRKDISPVHTYKLQTMKLRNEVCSLLSRACIAKISRI